MSTLRTDNLQTTDSAFSISVEDIVTGLGDALGFQADLLNSADITKGAALVGYRGRLLSAKLLDGISVKDFGAVGDGIADDTSAVQAALAVSNHVYFPAGTYNISSPLLISNKNMQVTGESKNAVKIQATVALATGMFRVISSLGLAGTSRFPTVLKDLSLVAGLPAAGTAIHGDYTFGSAGFVYTGINSIVLDNVDVRGSDYFSAGLNYWTTGLYLKNTGSVQLSKLNMLGKQNIVGTKGIFIESTNGPNTSFFVNDLAITWFEKGVDILNNSGGLYTIEGLYFSDYEIVGCDRGVHVRGGPVHALRMANGHINGETAAVQYDITAYGSTTFGSVNNYMQIANLYSGTYKSGSVVALDGVHFSQIRGGYISGKPSPFTVAQNGVAFLSSNRCNIDGVTFVDLNGTGVLIGSDGVNGECIETFSGPTNNFQNVNTKVAFGGTTNGAAVATRTVSGSISSAQGPKQIWGTSAVTLDAAGNGTVTFPDGGFPNNFFTAVVCNGEPAASGSLAFSVNIASSTKTTLVFSVRTNPGAVGVRVNYIAMGD